MMEMLQERTFCLTEAFTAAGFFPAAHSSCSDEEQFAICYLRLGFSSRVDWLTQLSCLLSSSGHLPKTFLATIKDQLFPFVLFFIISISFFFLFYVNKYMLSVMAFQMLGINHRQGQFTPPSLDSHFQTAVNVDSPKNPAQKFCCEKQAQLKALQIFVPLWWELVKQRRLSTI